MKILSVHNRYLQEGGEDAVFAAEGELLRSFGHEVVQYTDDNQRIARMGRLRTAVSAHWSARSKDRLARLISREAPHIAHFHNTFPLISPSAYYACRSAGVPVVQTLHNYRLLCPGALLMRHGRLCEDCIGRLLPWAGVLHACYRESRFQSATTASMLLFHRLIGTWNREVDVFIALSSYAQGEFIKGGLPQVKIAVKPSFIHPDPGTGKGPGDYALFAGRLSTEKGIDILLETWRQLPDVPLFIAGDGPLMDRVRSFSSSRGHIRVLGRLPRQEVLDLMKGARMLVFPSQCPENSPMAIAEAFASGRPVVAWSAGAAMEMVDHERTGLLCRPGDPQDFARSVMRLWTAPEEAVRMGEKARAEFEAHYTAERSYRSLMEIYARAQAARQRGTR